MHGVLLAESGNCHEAISVLETVPKQDEGWAEARLHLGDCMYQEKIYKDAIECYSDLLSGAENIHPIYRDAALRNIGFAYHDLGEYEAAVEYLKQVEHAYDDAPDMKAEVFGILASSYLHLGKTQEASQYSAISRGSSSVQ